MAPEQARGEVARLDERADVFGLGAILCVILTGQPPFVPTPEAGVYHQAVKGDLAGALARLEGCGADGELIGIARDCLALRPEARPRDAGEVAARVTGYRAGVQERLRAAELERTAAEAKAAEAGAKVRAERRARRLTAGLAVAGLLLLGLSGGTAWWLQRTQAATERDVTAALRDANTRLHLAWQQTDDPEKWRATLQEAWAAVGQAEGVLASGAASEALVQAVRQVKEEVERADAGRRLLADLDDIRLAKGDVRDGHFDSPGAAPRYANAFRGSELDVLAQGVSEAAERLRAHPFRDRLVAALEDWAGVMPPGDEQEKLRRVLAAVEEEGSFRRRWQAALKMQDRAALDRLLEEVEAGAVPPAAVVSVGQDDSGPDRERLLRAGQRRYPDDFWINHELARLLEESQPPRPGEAVGCYRAALALRSRSPGVHNNLGNALCRNGQLDVGIGCYRRALELDPGYALAHYNLGKSLQSRGQLDEAIGCYRRALELDPGYAPTHNNLGAVLESRSQLDEAIGCYRRAIQLDPRLALAHTNLGSILRARGQLDEAIRCFRRAIEIDPGSATGHNNLGTVLEVRSQPDEAICCYRRALSLDPGYASAHYNLGKSLLDRGQPDEAIRCFRRALELNPSDAQAHTNLGNGLWDKGEYEEAISNFRKAIAIQPGLAEAHCNLGLILQTRGRFAEALRHLQHGHALGSRQPRWRYPSGEWVRECRHLLHLQSQLPDLLAGRITLASAAERIEYARLCRQTRCYAAATRLYKDALTANPRLADNLGAGHRYNAARAAALAAAGQGTDAAQLDDPERARLRQQALGWLRADLALWAKRAVGEGAQRAVVQKGLRHWQQDSDLASVRGQQILARLPAEERVAWERLWADVDALLRQAGGQK
jgi:serine/threonine-protein kinase